MKRKLSVFRWCTSNQIKSKGSINAGQRTNEEYCTLYVRNPCHFDLITVLIALKPGNSTNPGAGYADRLGPSGKFVENSTELP